MQLLEIIERIDAVCISPNATITQLKHEEDDELYRVWRIDSDDCRYILKEAKGNECEIYQAACGLLKEGIPALYQMITIDEKTYLLMEYIEGESLCNCNRRKLTLALDALISVQKKCWEGRDFDRLKDSYEISLVRRQNRGKYLNDPLLEDAYERFLRVYRSTPKTLCHDDLLPFNMIVSEQKAVLIDWESCGILPYPTSFARLIAHTENDAQALFCMTQADKEFAVRYYYENLLKEKGITYTNWLNTLEYFLFYEYCEWVFVGHKYDVTDGKYYQKYLPIAKQQAAKLLAQDNQN